MIGNELIERSVRFALTRSSTVCQAQFENDENIFTAGPKMADHEGRRAVPDQEERK
jgi:hypothetical protein